MLDNEFLELELKSETEELFYEEEPLAADFETTGLKKHPNNALSLSLVICDDQLPLAERPTLNLLFLHTPQDVQDVALAMNARQFVARALAKNVKYEALVDLIEPQTLAEGLRIFETYTAVADWDAARILIDDFLNKYYGINNPTLLGKNIQKFDRAFFPDDINSYFAEEVIDVGLLWKKEGDKKNPNTAECCRRAGISDVVFHDAYADNLQAMQLWEIARDKRVQSAT